MHKKQVITAGITNGAARALILIHGRGGTAIDILSLADHLAVRNYKLIAPQAVNNTWYPNSFLAPQARNEPWLSSALAVLQEVVNDLLAEGFGSEHIYFMGFSQGACLTLEYVTRNAMRYGGIVAFTGGLIGDKIHQENYAGDFAGTPVLLATGNTDSHFPVERIHATAHILRDQHAAVTEKIYPNMGHTITQDEIHLANKLIFQP